MTTQQMLKHPNASIRLLGRKREALHRAIAEELGRRKWWWAR